MAGGSVPVIDALNSPHSHQKGMAETVHQKGMAETVVGRVGGVRLRPTRRTHAEGRGGKPARRASGLGLCEPARIEGLPDTRSDGRATAGLESPDAILGAGKICGGVAVIYVEKQLNAATTNNCSSTPSWALTSIDTGHPRNANKDVVTIRVATTTDGVNFSDVGSVSGLQDPTTTPFNGIRWLGSGSHDPQGIVTDRSRVTIVFAGYNTPQPSSNLGDYRTIGRFQFRFPEDYVARSHHLDAD